MEFPFADLALGTRFRYLGNRRVYVKIGHNEIAEWEESKKAIGRVTQGVYSFVDDEKEIFQPVDVL